MARMSRIWPGLQTALPWPLALWRTCALCGTPPQVCANSQAACDQAVSFMPQGCASSQSVGDHAVSSMAQLRGSNSGSRCASLLQGTLASGCSRQGSLPPDGAWQNPQF